MRPDPAAGPDSLSRLRAALAAAPGDAYDEAEPIEPIVPLPRLTDAPYRPAAVLIPIIAHPEPTILFTRRPATMRQHAGQISFPGGRIDPDDRGPVEAALREAEEEVALPRDRVEVLGRLGDVIVGTGFIVTPVVGVVPPNLPLQPAEAEVEALFEAPLAHVADPALHRLETHEFAGAPRSFYVVHWKEHRIWGATARMLVELGRRLG